MYTRFKKLLSVCLVISIMFMQMIFMDKAYAAPAKYRLFGAGRIQTSIEISKTGWPSTSDYAVLATAYDFPDALCAAPLARRHIAPLLLTEGSALNPSIKEELLRLKVKNVIIVGGPGVISDKVLNSVKSIANVERVYGSDREGTSVEVAKKLGAVTEAVLTTGLNFPDALSISSIAAYKGMPILLTGKDKLNTKVEGYLRDSGVKTTYIIGGIGAISSSIETKVPGAVRLAGTGRVQTNYEILKRFSNDFDYSWTYIATALDFPDALSGSALAALTAAPIILIDGPVLEDTKKLAKESINADTGIIALGGTAAVSDYVVNDLISYITSNVPGNDLKVEAVTVVSLNQIKVVYDKKVDKASAEPPSNYRLGDVFLTASDKIELQPDGRTVIITLNKAAAQQENKVFTVKDKAILSEDSLSTVKRYETELNFIDTTEPAVKTVTASGSMTVNIEFTEAIRISTELISQIASLFKLDEQHLFNCGFTQAAAVNPTTSNSYSNKIELKFGTGITSGSHVLTIPESASAYLVDEAGFRVKSGDFSFVVDTVTNAPRVIEVTGEDNGAVYITLDRSMDPVTAKSVSSYSANNASPLTADFKTGSDNKIVKLMFTPNVVTKGDNILVISRSVKDAYGNPLDLNNDVRQILKVTGDNTKPSVLNVTVTDSTHIRIKFSEAVDNQYALRIGNYTIENSNGLALNNVSSITRADGSVYGDTFIINLSTALTVASYTLKIKNIIDLAAANPNIMDDYSTTLSWIDSEAPSIVEEVMHSGSSSQIIVYFSEPMDRASITSGSNLFYKDGNGIIRELPSSAVIEAGADNKSVTVTFPNAYTVKTSNWYGQTDVRGIAVSGAKDTEGNILMGVSGYMDVTSANISQNRPTYVESTFKLYSDGDKVWAEFELSEALASLYISDFRVAGVIPDAGYLSGSKVTLTFVNSDKMSAIKGAGTSAQLVTAANLSTNSAGARINTISGKVVQDDRIAPELVSVSAFGGRLSDNLIKVRFSETIDSAIVDSYKDDFYFLGGGTTIEAKYVTVSGEYVIYHFNPGSFIAGDRIIVRALANNSNIRDTRDGYGDYNIYTPRSGDISGISAIAQ